MLNRYLKWVFVPLLALAATSAVLIACGGEETIVIQTVEVPVDREVRVVETVVIEKEVEVPGETKIETVVVERERIVEGETVIETVVVEREVVVTEKETVVETVVVEKEVQVAGETVIQTVVVEKEVEVVVQATPTPAPETFYGLPIPEAAPTISEPPSPQTGSDTVVIRTGLELRGSGIPGDPSGEIGRASCRERV